MFGSLEERPLLGGAAPRRLQRSAAIAVATALFVAAGIFVLSARIDGAQPAPLESARAAAARSAVSRVVATNEYGELAESTRLLYGVDFVVEPHRASVLRVEGAGEGATWDWRVYELARGADATAADDDDVSQRARTALLHAASRSAQARVTCARPGPLARPHVSPH